MLIKKLELRNIKSYGAATQIPFASGVNAISGPNGAGKSTILEAIGFALFDQLPYKQSQFLREGEKRGEIVVTFIDAVDEREYQVVRPIGGGTLYIYDPQIKRRVVTGKADTGDWLQEHLGIDPTADLKALFRDAVGVPQGALTAPFLETRASLRKATFDPLLQVDDYETAWERLRETIGYVRDLRQEQEKRIAELAGQLKRLPGLQREAEELQAQIAANQASLEEITTRLAQVKGEKEALDALKAQTVDLNGRLEGVRGRLGQLSRRLSDAESGVQEAQNAQTAVAQSEAGHRAYAAAQARLAELETQRGQRDDVRAQLNEVTRQLALVTQAVATHQKALQGIAEAEARLAELRPLIAQQEQLEADLREAERDAERWQESQRRLAEEIKRLEKIRGELAGLRTTLEERQALEQKAEELAASRRQKDQALEQLETRLAGLEADSDQATAALRAIEQTEWEQQQAQERLAEAEAQLVRLQADLEGVRADLQRRRETEASLADAEKERLDEEKALADADKEQALLHAQTQSLGERLTVLGQAEAAQCPVCQQPLTAEHAQDLSAHYEEEQRALKERLKVIGIERQDLEVSLAALRVRVTELQGQLDALPRPARETELAGEVEERADGVTELKGQLAELATALEPAGTARARHQELLQGMAAARQERHELNQGRAAIEERLAAVRDRISELPHPDREHELAAELETQERRIDEQEAHAAALSGAPERVASLQNQLAELGDPRQEGHRLKAEVDKRPATEQELARAGQEQTELEGARAETEAALEPYVGLDEAIAQQQDLLERHEADHRRYLQNQQAAQSLPQRQQRWTELQEEGTQVEAEEAEINQALESVRSGYDAAHHEALVEELGWLDRHEASLAERLRLEEGRLESIEAEMDELQQLQDDLITAESQRDAFSHLGEVLRFIRETIRQAGPYVTRRLVQAISIEADNIFGDVIADHAMRLSWGEDYAISVESRGEQRIFQQLSGGEQMAAALAVRLALLREMSDVDIAFFDEPTANLDDERRENLAEKLTGIKGFSQLFVISHDDTFEQETQHVVRVRKENGTSRVEVG